jgi:hypothetical protein
MPLAVARLVSSQKKDDLPLSLVVRLVRCRETATDSKF